MKQKDPETKFGLNQSKYTVHRNGSVETKVRHKNCQYLVLDWKHDKFAIPAAAAYAAACEAEYPLLAQDLRKLISIYGKSKKVMKTKT